MRERVIERQRQATREEREKCLGFSRASNTRTASPKRRAPLPIPSTNNLRSRYGPTPGHAPRSNLKKFTNWSSAVPRKSRQEVRRQFISQQASKQLTTPPCNCPSVLSPVGLGLCEPACPKPSLTLHLTKHTRTHTHRLVNLTDTNASSFSLAALDHPFLLLPFRPTSDPSAVRTFVRHFFDNHAIRGETLAQELRMTEPMVGFLYTSREDASC